MPKIDKQWLASIGITADDLKQAATPVPIDKEPASMERSTRDALGTLRALNWPREQLTPIRCWECQEIFLTNYVANVYCSQQCFKGALAKKGIAWRPERSYADQWGQYEPPISVPPGALEVMRHLIRLADSGNRPQLQNPEPDSFSELSTEEHEVLPDPPIPYIDPEIPSEPEDSDDGFLAMLDAL